MIEKGYTISVLDHGFVRLIDWMGDDKRIVEAARISYKSPSKGDEQDKKLLFFLYKNAHSSPFEQVNITFNIKMPIFVMREFVRHRTFRLNELSARYAPLPNEFYIPKEWRKQDNKNKQGSISDEDFKNNGIQEWATSELDTHCQHSYNLYEQMIKGGIAREMARMILPVNIYTEIYVNCDIRNLMHFFNLRLSEKAQWEIRQIASGMFNIFKELYPWCAEAYNKYQFQMIEEK